MEVTQKAVRYLLDQRNFREARQELLQTLMKDLYDKNRMFVSDIATEMALLSTETTDYEAFVDKVEAATLNPKGGGDDEWARRYGEWWRRCRNQDRLLTLLSLAELTGHGDSETNLRKYRRVLLQQMRKNNARDHAYRFEQIMGKPMPEFL